ncbi:MAG TPA: glycoside hydrolase family 38 C-terminal domain-containing protein [Gemmatimonadaceae bacterium]|nr:glycoside hydrolase family 38 C-terminal domain-containing protein [Gemmatimonadaceae bacterium]
MTVVHVVSHTHWDREWYLPAGRLRQRLIALVDELIDAPPRGGASFLLDGQAVVVEDYLDVRPERSAALAALLTSGTLEAGPWFVLADELISGGEALVRNLIAGRRTLHSLGAASPAVLYCPDSFGHPAMLPALACGFGCAVVIVWRGYGGARWPAGDAVWWVAPDGERVLLHHLSRSGYELGANLPADAHASHDRWVVIHGELIPRNTTGVTLLLNGADHHARQEGLDESLMALTHSARPDNIQPSSLAAFADDALRAAAAPGTALPEVRGELRDSYGYAWTLQGTLATRAAQKRRNAQIERTLVRDAEPWVAFAVHYGASTISRKQVMDSAWRALLLCHPHDTLCGCSTDEVARAMDARLDDAGVQALGIRVDALADLIGHRADLARETPAAWRPVVVVRNSAARPREGVALLKLTTFLADVPIGIGSASPSTPPAASRVARAMPGVAVVQVLSRAVEHERTESPRHYPDDDLVSASHVAAWVDEVPAYGIRCFDQRTARMRPIPNPARIEGNSATNGRIMVQVDDEGRVEFRDFQSGRSTSHLLQWESLADAGDLYTPAPRGVALVPVFRGSHAINRGPVRAALEMRWSFHSGRERLLVRTRLIVDANAPWLQIHIEGDNATTNHRLRLGIRTDVAGPVVVADAMFGPVERRPLAVPPEDARIEQPPPTAPLHRYVSLFGSERGATLFSDGLAEYEATDNGTVLVTMLRAVGELSRPALSERPSHAGWPTSTPEAQSPGPFAARLALMFHGGRGPRTTDEIERASDDILLPLRGETLRSALALPGPVPGVELRGEGLAFSAAKQSEDGEWLVLRCVNLLNEQRGGAWYLAAPVERAQLARLDETPVAPLVTDGATVAFIAPARGIVTILVR